MEKRIFNLDHLDTIAHDLWAVSNTIKVYSFTGTLGAGKTTLIKAIMRQAGVKDLITSPTFTIVNEYRNEKDQRFFHFDLYRIASLDEFMQGGFNEYLYAPGSWCFIEWPQIIESLLTHNVMKINLEVESENAREITFSTKLK